MSEIAGTNRAVGSGIRCPECSTAMRVKDTRTIADGTEVRRRRECLECGYRLTTKERVVGEGGQVIPFGFRRLALERLDEVMASA